MDGRRDDDRFVVDGDAVDRWYGPRGIGRPTQTGELALTWVEAAYLLARGDLDTVAGKDARRFMSSPPDRHAVSRLVAYRDLRERGYYVTTAYEPGEPSPEDAPSLIVRPRGADPTGDAVAHRLHVHTETSSLPTGGLDPSTFAIVDDEAEVTYVSVEDARLSGSWSAEGLPRATGVQAGDRVLVFDPPAALYRAHYFGQPLDEGSVLGLNLLEARYLEEVGAFTIEGLMALEERAAADGDTFDRRYAVFRRLRDSGLVPRSGLKFGTDFRVYETPPADGDPGHSEHLVEVVSATERVDARHVARAVRLATGVRKRHVMAIVENTSVTWRAFDRLTP